MLVKSPEFISSKQLRAQTLKRRLKGEETRKTDAFLNCEPQPSVPPSSTGFKSGQMERVGLKTSLAFYFAVMFNPV